MIDSRGSTASALLRYAKYVVAASETVQPASAKISRAISMRARQRSSPEKSTSVLITFTTCSAPMSAGPAPSGKSVGTAGKRISPSRSGTPCTSVAADLAQGVPAFALRAVGFGAGAVAVVQVAEPASGSHNGFGFGREVDLFARGAQPVGLPRLRQLNLAQCCYGVSFRPKSSSSAR